MNLTLNRFLRSEDGIFGTLEDETGSHVCYTLEHAYLDLALDPSGGFSPKIPPGVYVCKRGQHQLHSMKVPFTTFEVTNVKGHTNILLHQGNYNKDSDGCILLGSDIFPAGNKKDTKMITDSKHAFELFINLQANLNEFTLTVV